MAQEAPSNSPILWFYAFLLRRNSLRESCFCGSKVRFRNHVIVLPLCCGVSQRSLTVQLWSCACAASHHKADLKQLASSLAYFQMESFCRWAWLQRHASRTGTLCISDAAPRSPGDRVGRLKKSQTSEQEVNGVGMEEGGDTSSLVHCIKSGIEIQFFPLSHNTCAWGHRMKSISDRFRRGKTKVCAFPPLISCLKRL